jgi:hypothetical protein
LANENPRGEAMNQHQAEWQSRLARRKNFFKFQRTTAEAENPPKFASGDGATC